MPTAASGNDGRVQSGGVPVAMLNKWALTKQTQKVVIPHFESPVDGDGNLWPTLVRGLSSATGSASGFMDVGAPPDAGGLSNGLFATLDLILVKNAAFGIKNLPVFIDQVEIGTDVNNQAASFSMGFTVNGIAGKSGS